jgi:hypothetical protein
MIELIDRLDETIEQFESARSVATKLIGSLVWVTVFMLAFSCLLIRATATQLLHNRIPTVTDCADQPSPIVTVKQPVKRKRSTKTVKKTNKINTCVPLC